MGSDSAVPRLTVKATGYAATVMVRAIHRADRRHIQVPFVVRSEQRITAAHAEQIAIDRAQAMPELFVLGADCERIERFEPTDA